MNVHSSTIHDSEKAKTTERPPAGERTRQGHRVENDPALKRDGVLTHTTTFMTLENTTQGERSQYRKATHTVPVM